MTRDERLTYGKGYQAGIRGKWPAHRPPYPPNEIVAEFLGAFRDVRDRVDGLLAVIGDEEDWETKFGPIIDRADAAAEHLTAWLVIQEEKKNDR